MLEHMLFKKFPQFDLWKTLGDRGARINAVPPKHGVSLRRADRGVDGGAEFGGAAYGEKPDRGIEDRTYRGAVSLVCRACVCVTLSHPLSPALCSPRSPRSNEFERGKNSPTNLLREEVYRVSLGESSTIGSAHDIENIMNHADDLRAFFHKYYCCANAAI